MCEDEWACEVWSQFSEVKCDAASMRPTLAKYAVELFTPHFYCSSVEADMKLAQVCYLPTSFLLNNWL